MQNIEIVLLSAALIAFISLIIVSILYSVVRAAMNKDLNEDTIDEISSKFELIFTMAKKFVILAKKEFNDNEGVTKKNWVITNLRELCRSVGLELSDQELEAINEDAYKNMKKDEMI
jgi:hypothetical protein